MDLDLVLPALEAYRVIEIRLLRGYEAQYPAASDNGSIPQSW